MAGARAGTRPLQPQLQSTQPPQPQQQGQAATGAQQAPAQQTNPPALTVVVLDPAHGGADLGARGSSGINESDVVLDFTRSVRAALESQGLRVVQTRTGDEDPTFDDRSATANAQRGAIFISLHVASTGPLGQVRVYSEPLPEAPSFATPSVPYSFPARNGLLSWDKAQEPYAAASRRLAELSQTALAQALNGSPAQPTFAQVRQLRTVAAPAIAVELSSVSVSDRDQLTRFAPNLANALSQAVANFKPVYASAAHY
jgi:N-acetylmuramoyl-L-alanine amidase